MAVDDRARGKHRPNLALNEFLRGVPLDWQERETKILPDADLEATQARAEVLRETAKNLIAQYRGQALDRVTARQGR